MLNRVSTFRNPFDVTSLGILFAGEGDTGGGGGAPDAGPAGAGGDGQGAKPTAPDKPADPAAASKADTDAADRLEGQKRVNRDLEGKLNQMRDGLKTALGIDDKKATVEDLVASLKDEIGGLRRENLVEKVARRHNITSDDDIALLQSATDSQAMERLAARLAPKGDGKDANDTSGKPGSKPKPDSSQGRGGGSDAPGSRPSSVAEVMEQRRAEREKREPSRSS